MSDEPNVEEKKSDSGTGAPLFGRKAQALVGLIAVLALCWLVNFLVGILGPRIDLTEANLFTLSDGTKRILSRLESPVKIRYYVTDETLSPGELDRVRRIEDLLKNLVRYAPTKKLSVTNEEGEFVEKNVKLLTVEKLNPQPDTDAEDMARLDKVRPGMSAATQEQAYFSLAIHCIDTTETIDFPIERPNLLEEAERRAEYDIMRAITRVHGGEKRKLRIMTSVQIDGGQANFQAPPTPPW
ncbi:MAG: GldG family protein, partial [Verrucomicrobiales bacterium]|nr:GldG family protein [Verrucomicrobiales bacterium]